MDILKSIAVDITRSVFDNDTAAMMYVIKDIYSESFVISIPVITFSCDICSEKDYEWLRRSVPIGDPGRKERLVEAIKAAIAGF